MTFYKLIAVLLIGVAAFVWEWQKAGTARQPTVVRESESVVWGRESSASARIVRASTQILRTTHEVPAQALRRDMLATLGTHRAKFDFHRAQRFQTDAGPMWVVQAPQLLCLVQERHIAVGCVANDAFLRSGLSLGLFTPGRHPTEAPRDFTLVGLAPDWANSVELAVDGEARQVRVKTGVFVETGESPVLFRRLLP